MNIVIIEDEIELGQLMQKFLLKSIKSNTPNQIKIATNLKDGLHYIDEINPDWVFLDNNLPDGKGINYITTIKQGASGIIMMSAMSNLKEKALELGADYFMDKPISFVEVQRIINDDSFFAPASQNANA
jgi:DNA-binding response OmpR family regulator